jgi:alanine dehydrogenase
LARDGLRAISADPHLANGLNVHQGRVTNAAVAASLCLEYVPPSAALAP